MAIVPSLGFSGSSSFHVDKRLPLAPELVRLPPFSGCWSPPKGQLYKRLTGESGKIPIRVDHFECHGEGEHSRKVIHGRGDGPLGSDMAISPTLSAPSGERIKRLEKQNRRLAGVAVVVLLAGVAAFLLSMLGMQARRRAASAGCGIKAELHEVRFPAVFNPNTVELEYLVTNQSGVAYELPASFRALRKFDNVLHADANNLGFPSNRLFPVGRAVEFSVAVNFDLLDHPPTEQDTKKLQKLLSGTQSYVIIDEQHGCEIEFPVQPTSGQEQR